MEAKKRLFAAVGLMVVLCVGCQRANTLEGTVTYNGQPVEEGSLSFQPVDGATPGFGAKIVDGHYSAQKVWPGEHTVRVRGLNKQVTARSSAEAIEQYEEAKAAGEKTLDHYGQPTDYIPEDAEGNGQTVEIQPGSNTLNLELEGPPRP